jgi:capsular exopolysaccharide synthesis family protein
VRRRKGGATMGEMWEAGGQVGEAFRALRANLQYLGVAHPLRTILVTSASPKQGKTTITAHLAVAIASSGASVVAVEGDLRRPELANSLGVHGSSGLTNVLVGSADLQRSLVDVPLDVDPRSSGIVSLLPSGPLPPNPSELLGSLQMRELLDRLTGLYDYALIDSPPLLLVADTLDLARMVDGVVFVARRNQVTSDEAREVRATVDRLGLKLLGVVMTDAEPLAPYYGGYEAAQQPEAQPPAPSPESARAESLVGDGL